jgi:uncharacterized protein YecT (DUF1311 family)
MNEGTASLHRQRALPARARPAALVTTLCAMALCGLSSLPATAQAQGTPMEQRCFEAGQGKVAWNREGSKAWNEANLRALCRGTTNPAATLACFSDAIRTHNDWARGIQSCAAGTTPAAPAPATASAPAPAPARPAEPPIDCVRVEQGAGNAYEMSVCAERARTQLQSRMDQTVRQLKEFMRTDLAGAKSLNESQAAWMAWRDKEALLCASAAGFSPDGSGYGVAAGNCSTALTRERLKQLEAHLAEFRRR